MICFDFWQLKKSAHLITRGEFCISQKEKHKKSHRGSVYILKQDTNKVVYILMAPPSSERRPCHAPCVCGRAAPGDGGGRDFPGVQRPSPWRQNSAAFDRLDRVSVFFCQALTCVRAKVWLRVRRVRAASGAVRSDLSRPALRSTRRPRPIDNPPRPQPLPHATHAHNSPPEQSRRRTPDPISLAARPAARRKVHNSHRWCTELHTSAR